MRKPTVAFVFLAVVLQFFLLAEAWSQSPYRLDPTREILLFSGGTVMGVGALILHDQTDALSQEEIATLTRQDINGFDRGATWKYSEGAGTASDYLVYGLLAATPAFLLERRVRDDWRTYLVMYGETLLLTGATVQLTKGLVARTRPYAYNPDVLLDTKMDVDARKSFYSSHTAFAFASAVFLSTTYAAYCPESPLRPWIWTLSLTAATTVGVLRYVAGEHFPSDVLVGAALGAAIGYLVPTIHTMGSNELSVIPSPGPQAASVCVVLRF